MELIFQEAEGGVMVVSLDGGLDGQTVEGFNDAVDKIVAGGMDRLIIDASRMTYVSSLGLATLVRLRRRMRDKGGDVKLAGLCGPVWDVVRLARLDAVLGVYEDVERARLAFREPG